MATGIRVKVSEGIYLLKVNNRNTRTRCKICSKLTIKSPKRHQNDAIGLVLVCLLLTLNILHTYSIVSIVNFEHVIAGWERYPSASIIDSVKYESIGLIYC